MVVVQSLLLNVNKNKRGKIKIPLFTMCAGHGINLTGESPVTGIYRQM